MGGRNTVIVRIAMKTRLRKRTQIDKDMTIPFYSSRQKPHTDLHLNSGSETVPGIDSLITQFSLNPQKLVILGETLASN
jgi:hypothetical protein